MVAHGGSLSMQNPYAAETVAAVGMTFAVGMAVPFSSRRSVKLPAYGGRA
jgi:hypothetical protein